jgi:hypothetical protein
MNIELHIERLILDGLPVSAAQGPLVQAAIETELARLLGDDARLSQLSTGFAVNRVTGENFHLTRDAHPATLGHQIARAVRGSIGKNFSAPAGGGGHTANQESPKP